MDIKISRTGKITITFGKKTTCIKQGDWVSDGHALVNAEILQATGGKVVYKHEDANRAAILGTDFFCQYGKCEEGRNVDFEGIISQARDHDTVMTGTTLVYNNEVCPYEIFHANRSVILNGLTSIAVQYLPLVRGEVRTNSRNHDSWTSNPFSAYTDDGDLLALIMPCKVDDTPELNAIAALHTSAPYGV